MLIVVGFVPSRYSYGDMLFNYGCFPQTWEDPAHITEECNARGDNDPIDAMEIGTQILPTGSIVKVKVSLVMS